MIQYLFFFIIWAVGVCLLLNFLNSLDYFSGKYKWLCLLSLPFSWAALLILFLYLLVEDAIESIKENFCKK